MSEWVILDTASVWICKMSELQSLPVPSTCNETFYILFFSILFLVTIWSITFVYLTSDHRTVTIPPIRGWSLLPRCGQVMITGKQHILESLDNIHSSENQINKTIDSLHLSLWEFTQQVKTKYRVDTRGLVLFFALRTQGLICVLSVLACTNCVEVVDV